MRIFVDDIIVNIQDYEQHLIDRTGIFEQYKVLTISRDGMTVKSLHADTIITITIDELNDFMLRPDKDEL